MTNDFLKLKKAVRAQIKMIQNVQKQKDMMGRGDL